jgi:hypothetical protein
MKPLIRFGRRIPIPSTLQIRNELRNFSVEKFMAEVCPETGASVIAPEDSRRTAPRLTTTPQSIAAGS